MKKSVYIVSDGDYSDYHVCGVYSSRSRAKHAQKLYNSSNRIERFILDKIPNFPRGRLPFCVGMKDDGTVVAVRQISPSEIPPFCKWKPGVEENVDFFVFAKDSEHAVKIANEKRIGIQLSGEWTTNWFAWRAKQREAAKKD